MSEITDPSAAHSRDVTIHGPHAQIMAHVDALPGLAEMIDKVEPETIAQLFEAECDFIAVHLVPHIVAEEATLYRELERLMDKRHSMEPMREEHVRLRRLFTALCQYREVIARGEFDRESTIGLRRVLYRMYSLLKVHLAEEEMYLRVVERDLSADERDALARAMDHAAAEPI